MARKPKKSKTAMIDARKVRSLRTFLLTSSILRDGRYRGTFVITTRDTREEMLAELREALLLNPVMTAMSVEKLIAKIRQERRTAYEIRQMIDMEEVFSGAALPITSDMDQLLALTEMGRVH